MYSPSAWCGLVQGMYSRRSRLCRQTQWVRVGGRGLAMCCASPTWPGALLSRSQVGNLNGGASLSGIGFFAQHCLEGCCIDQYREIRGIRQVQRDQMRLFLEQLLRASFIAAVTSAVFSFAHWPISRCCEFTKTASILVSGLAMLRVKRASLDSF